MTPTKKTTPVRIVTIVVAVAVLLAVLFLPVIPSDQQPAAFDPDEVKAGISLFEWIFGWGERNRQRREKILTLYYIDCKTVGETQILSGRTRKRVDKVIADFKAANPAYNRECPE